MGVLCIPIPCGRIARNLAALALVALMAAGGETRADDGVQALDLEKPAGTIRVATFNASLARMGAGRLIVDLEAGKDRQVRNVVEIILRVRPDILLINELDYDPAGRALAGLAALLARGKESRGKQELDGIDYPVRHTAAVNTGVPSGMDIDGDGKIAGPGDAFGFGRFPGQYGMALLSRYPVAAARSYRLFPWARMPGAMRPVFPGGRPFHRDEVWQALRLSSKSHWDIALDLPGERRLHVLAAHPTPPVFDGPENRNGRRNADEIRLLMAMLDGADWLVDDDGARAEAPASAVIMGDLNADPLDGEGRPEGIEALLAHPRVQDPLPESPGGAEARAQGGANAKHRGKAARDTADWRDGGGPGNLRVDYVLPTRDLEVVKSGVFWPVKADKLARLVKQGKSLASSDHRLVWVDLRLPE